MIHRYRALFCLGLGLLGSLAACGADPLKPTPTPTDLVARALADTKSLTRYHFGMVVTIEGDDPKEARIIGDAIAPDQVYAAVSAPPTLTPYEFMNIGEVYYTKEAGVWVTPAPYPTFPPTPESGQFRSSAVLMVPHSTGNWPTSMILDVLPTAEQLTDAGPSALNVADDPAATPVPVTVRHFTFTLDPAKQQQRPDRSVADYAIGGSVDIDPVSGHLYRFTMTVDRAQQTRAIFATMGAELGIREATPNPAEPTPTLPPGMPTSETWTYTLTRHNDPAITLPTP